MPYDGTQSESAQKVIRLIDCMLEIFGPNGEHWMQCDMFSVDGSMCLLGALDISRTKLDLRTTKFRSYFHRALRRVGLPNFSVIDFNDTLQVRFQHIRGLLLLMRQIVDGNDPGLLFNRRERKGRWVNVLLEGLLLLEKFSRDQDAA